MGRPPTHLTGQTALKFILSLLRPPSDPAVCILGWRGLREKKVEMERDTFASRGRGPTHHAIRVCSVSCSLFGLMTGEQ